MKKLDMLVILLISLLNMVNCLLYSSHRCVGDGTNITEIEKRVCIFKNVCLKTAPKSNKKSFVNLVGAPHPQEENNPTYKYFKDDILWPPAKLIYFRDPSAPVRPIGTFDNDGKMLYNFPPNDGFRIVASKKCTYPYCTFAAVEEEFGSLPSKSTLISHRIGLAGIMCIYNLGHLIFDSMFPLYYAQLRLCLHHIYDFQLASIASCGEDVNCAEGTSLEPKFGPMFSKHRLTTAMELYKAGVKRKNADNGYLCFRELIVGNKEGLSVTGQYDFTLSHFRSFVLHNMKLDPLFVPTKPLILLFYKAVSSSDLGRGLLNIDEVNRTMTAKFGDTFQITKFKGMSAVEQMELLQRTTVFITPGSGGTYLSFVMAKGTVRIQFDLLNEKQTSEPFDYFLFTHLPITPWRYQVDSSEYRVEKGSHWYAGVYVLNCTKLIEMTERALREVEFNRESGYFN